MRQHESRIKRGMTGGVGLRIPADDRAALDRIAAERGVGISVVLRDALRRYIDANCADRGA